LKEVTAEQLQARITPDCARITPLAQSVGAFILFLPALTTWKASFNT